MAASESNRTRLRAEEFALLVDAVEEYAIFILGPDGTIRSWNSGAARIMGYDEEEIIGRNFSVFYAAEDAAKPKRELQVAAAVGRVEDEGWRLRKDGTRFWANTVITALRNTDGTIRGFAKVTRDMSARVAAQEELRQSAEVFKLLVSSVRDYAIFMLDPQGNVVTWNNGAQRIKGYTPEEIIGRHFSTFYPPEDLATNKPGRELEIAKKNGSVEDEGWRVRKDGTRFWANVVITAVHDAKGQLRGFAKVTRDITDRKKAEEIQHALLEQREARLQAEEERRRAENSYREAQEANRAKDEFLMTLSHELRTPMTAILGWSRLLLTMKPDDPLFRDAVAGIANGAQLQARLIDDILDVSRVVSGKLRLAPETIDIARVILNAVDAVSTTAAAKEIKITTTLAPQLGLMVADATRLQQVIWNLLANAVKFTPKKGTVQISARRSSSQVQIDVTDDGEGIDAQFLPHVFEPFRQAETPSTRVHGGLGLGLSIVRYIAEAHGGRVSAHSEGRGKGSTFTVSLPIRPVTTEPNMESPGDTFKYGNRLRDLAVVVVDDDLASRKIVSAVLSAAGASVMVFESAVAALDAIDKRHPDIVVTDIAMPEVDGYALARTLRKRDRERGGATKIVALSAFPAAMEERGTFDAYLSKPIDPFKLVEEIERAAPRASA